MSETSGASRDATTPVDKEPNNNDTDSQSGIGNLSRVRTNPEGNFQAQPESSCHELAEEGAADMRLDESLTGERDGFGIAPCLSKAPSPLSLKRASPSTDIEFQHSDLIDLLSAPPLIQIHEAFMPHKKLKVVRCNTVKIESHELTPPLRPSKRKKLDSGLGGAEGGEGSGSGGSDDSPTYASPASRSSSSTSFSQPGGDDLSDAEGDQESIKLEGRMFPLELRSDSLSSEDSPRSLEAEKVEIKTERNTEEPSDGDKPGGGRLKFFMGGAFLLELTHDMDKEGRPAGWVQSKGKLYRPARTWHPSGSKKDMSPTGVESCGESAVIAPVSPQFKLSPPNSGSPVGLITVPQFVKPSDAVARPHRANKLRISIAQATFIWKAPSTWKRKMKEMFAHCVLKRFRVKPSSNYVDPETLLCCRKDPSSKCVCRSRNRKRKSLEECVQSLPIPKANKPPTQSHLPKPQPPKKQKTPYTIESLTQKPILPEWYLDPTKASEMIGYPRPSLPSFMASISPSPPPPSVKVEVKAEPGKKASGTYGRGKAVRDAIYAYVINDIVQLGGDVMSCVVPSGVIAEVASRYKTDLSTVARWWMKYCSETGNLSGHGQQTNSLKSTSFKPDVKSSQMIYPPHYRHQTPSPKPPRLSPKLSPGMPSSAPRRSSSTSSAADCVSSNGSTPTPPINPFAASLQHPLGGLSQLSPLALQSAGLSEFAGLSPGALAANNLLFSNPAIMPFLLNQMYGIPAAGSAQLDPCGSQSNHNSLSFHPAVASHVSAGASPGARGRTVSVRPMANPTVYPQVQSTEFRTAAIDDSQPLDLSMHKSKTTRIAVESDPVFSSPRVNSGLPLNLSVKHTKEDSFSSRGQAKSERESTYSYGKWKKLKGSDRSNTVAARESATVATNSVESNSPQWTPEALASLSSGQQGDSGKPVFDGAVVKELLVQVLGKAEVDSLLAKGFNLDSQLFLDKCKLLLSTSLPRLQPDSKFASTAGFPAAPSVNAGPRDVINNRQDLMEAMKIEGLDKKPLRATLKPKHYPMHSLQIGSFVVNAKTEQCQEAKNGTLKDGPNRFKVIFTQKSNTN